MGASEDRATLAEHERQRRASEVDEIMVPGYGIWTADRLAELLKWWKTTHIMASPEQREQWREMGLL